MSDFMSHYMVPIAIGAVAVVLLLGLLNMMRGGSPNTSQRLMRWRVLLQFVAIIVITSAALKNENSSPKRHSGATTKQETTPHRTLDTPGCLCGDGKPIPSGVYGRWRANLGDQQEDRGTGRMEGHRQGHC